VTTLAPRTVRKALDDTGFDRAISSLSPLNSRLRIYADGYRARKMPPGSNRPGVLVEHRTGAMYHGPGAAAHERSKVEGYAEALEAAGFAVERVGPLGSTPYLVVTTTESDA
jgi:hypothetical protein